MFFRIVFTTGPFFTVRALEPLRNKCSTRVYSQWGPPGYFSPRPFKRYARRMLKFTSTVRQNFNVITRYRPTGNCLPLVLTAIKVQLPGLPEGTEYSPVHFPLQYKTRSLLLLLLLWLGISQNRRLNRTRILLYCGQNLAGRDLFRSNVYDSIMMFVFFLFRYGKIARAEFCVSNL